MALDELWRLDAIRKKVEGYEAQAISDEALFRARACIRQIIRDAFDSMRAARTARPTS